MGLELKKEPAVVVGNLGPWAVDRVRLHEAGAKLWENPGVMRAGQTV